MLFIEFDYIVQYKPEKMHLQANHLSRLSMELGIEDINDEFPDSQLFTVRKVPI